MGVETRDMARAQVRMEASLHFASIAWQTRARNRHVARLSQRRMIVGETRWSASAPMMRGEIKALRPPVARIHGKRWPLLKASITLPNGTVHIPIGRAIRKKSNPKRMRLVVGWVGWDTSSKREPAKAKINPQKLGRLAKGLSHGSTEERPR